MVMLTPRQATLVFGWARPRIILTWRDVLQRKLTLDQLVDLGLSAAQLVLLQPDPGQWVQHAGGGVRHARFLMPWGANPFAHLGADLADVLSLRLSLIEMIRMGITYQQLRAHGMNDDIERMFKLSEEEWGLLGKSAGLAPEGIKVGVE